MVPVLAFVAADVVFNDGKITKAVGNAVVDVVEFVVDDIIDPVMTTIGNVIDAALDDPIKAIAQVAAIATGNAWALPLIEGADVAIAGGDLGDVLKAVATSYVAQNVGSYVGKTVGSYVSDAATAAQYGVTQGSQQAAALAAQEAGMRTASQIAGQIAGSAAGAAAVAVVTGQDPVKAFVSGGVGAAVPAILGQVPGFTKLPPSGQQVIAEAVRTQLAGGNVTTAVIGSAIQASGIVTDIINSFDPDGTKLTRAQRAVAVDVLMGTTVAALSGGNVPAAIQAMLIKNGSKALGDMLTDGFKSAVDGVSSKYDAAQKAADAADANIAQQEKVAAEYNKVVTELNGRVAEQDRLKAEYDTAAAAQRANPTQATTDAANAAAKRYNDFVSKLNADYESTYKPQIDKYAGELAKIQEQYGNLEQVYQNAVKDVASATDKVKEQVAPAIDTSNKAFVEVMDPNFNADEYRKINNLGADVDVYDHWLSTGQFEGLKTNNKDVAVQAAVDKYEAATNESVPPRVREALTRPENQNRDVAIQQYVDASLKDRENEQAFRNSVAASVLDAYEAEGFSPEQINEKINSGEATRYIDGAIQRKRESISQMQEYTKATAEKYGQDSAEYKNAYRDTLAAMADVGGYGVVKEGNSFVLPEAGKLDPDTFKPITDTGGGYGYVDPVTGVYRVEIWMTNREDRDISSLWALGKSAKPPTQGGAAVFGDGSGVSAGLFGGIMPVAIDDKSGDAGAKMYGGGNGFALITYSDGRGAAINTKTQEVIWVSPEDVQKLLGDLPEPKSPLPEVANPDAPPPEKPEPIDPVKDATQQIKEKIQSPQEVVEALKAAGYTATLEEAKQLAGEKTAEQLRTEAAAYADPRVVDEQEVKDAYAALGLKKPTQADVAKLVGQYAQSELGSKAELNLDAARYNSLLEQIEAIGQQSGVDPAVLETIKADLNAQITALGGDVTALSNDVAAAKADLKGAIDAAQAGNTERFGDIDAAIQALRDAGLTTAQVQAIVDQSSTGLSAEFKAALDAAAQGNAEALGGVKTELESKIGGVQKAIADQMAAYEAAGLARDDALSLAITDVSGQLGTTKTELLAQLGTTEANLKAEIAAQVGGVAADVQAKYDALTAEQKALADALAQQGIDLNAAITQAQQQTQHQITGVQQDVQTKYDALTQGQKDLAAQLQQQGFDLNTAIELARQETQQGFTDVFGQIAANQTATQQAIAAAQAAAAADAERTRQAQAAEAERTRLANAAAALKTQRVSNLNTLTSMLMQAPDVGGQQVTVKAPDPAKIGYIYDWSSIFANPSQEKMFASPYGGFAKGGAVRSEVDDVNDELLKLLRG